MELQQKQIKINHVEPQVSVFYLKISSYVRLEFKDNSPDFMRLVHDQLSFKIKKRKVTCNALSRAKDLEIRGWLKKIRCFQTGCEAIEFQFKKFLKTYEKDIFETSSSLSAMFVCYISIPREIKKKAFQ